LHLAASEVERGEHVAIVELAHAWDDTSAVQAVASALDVQRRQHLSLESTLVEHLHGRRALLVLDNCEHLLDWVGPFVDRVRTSGAGVVVVATSREPLGLPGERVWLVGPLDVPGAEARSLDEVSASSSVRLFVDRAAAAQPGFALSTANAPAVAEICRRVDGLPLAIELAAARVKVLSPAALLERVEQRLPLLVGGNRDAPARQQTMRATIGMSDPLSWSG